MTPKDKLAVSFEWEPCGDDHPSHAPSEDDGDYHLAGFFDDWDFLWDAYGLIDELGFVRHLFKPGEPLLPLTEDQLQAKLLSELHIWGADDIEEV